MEPKYLRIDRRHVAESVFTVPEPQPPATSFDNSLGGTCSLYLFEPHILQYTVYISPEEQTLAVFIPSCSSTMCLSLFST